VDSTAADNKAAQEYHQQVEAAKAAKPDDSGSEFGAALMAALSKKK
jgi:hypothetical protein